MNLVGTINYISAVFSIEYDSIARHFLIHANHVTHAKILTHTKILWTHANDAKISTHATHITHAKILWTHATHAKIWPMPPTHPRTHATHTTQAI